MCDVLPTQWKEMKLAQLLGANSFFSDGDWVESRDQDTEGRNRLIQLADVGDGRFLNKSNRFLNDEQFARLRCTALVEGDILIARMPDPIGRACIFPAMTMRCATVVDVAILRNANTHPGWLIAAINSDLFRRKIEISSCGTTRTRISRSFLRELSLLVPPQAVQRRIADVLRSTDTAIEKTEALIAKYQQIKAGLMYDLFTRGVLPNGQLRPPRSEAPELYQETVIGWIPREWELSGLAGKSRHGTSWIRTGPFGSALKGEHWVEHGHPVITIGALGIGDFIEAGLLYIGTKDAARLSDFQLKAGDVVFSRVADVGRSAVIREEQSGWIMSSNLMRIALNESIARPDFLQMQLADDFRVKAQIRAMVTGGGREVANSAVLGQLRFAWPPLVEQDQIINLASGLLGQLRAEQRKVEKLNRQKLGLMQDLLTGKVPVKVGAGETAIDNKEFA